ncbi:hydrolase Cof, partial [Erysipelatoclostridium ramosum]|nr:hydrolase Cof [Thomasclavelia ramosa]
MQKYMQRKGKAQENIHIRTQFPNMVFGENLYRKDVNKISFILNSYADVTAARQYFPDLKISTWGGKGETALFGDIGIQDID